jgi:hypothetical protein
MSAARAGVAKLTATAADITNLFIDFSNPQNSQALTVNAPAQISAVPNHKSGSHRARAKMATPKDIRTKVALLTYL